MTRPPPVCPKIKNRILMNRLADGAPDEKRQQGIFGEVTELAESVMQFRHGYGR